MLNLKKKLVLDYENEVLIDMAQQLAYNNDNIEKIANCEVLQEDMNELALYMANSYIQQDDKNYHQSPLQTQRDYFNENIENVCNQYFNGGLPEIKYSPETLSPNEYGIIPIFKEAITEFPNIKELVEKDPELELNILNQLKENFQNHSCNTWCETVDSIKTKMNENGISFSNSDTIRIK